MKETQQIKRTEKRAWLRGKVQEFRKEHPEVSLATLCAKNNYSRAYINAAVNLKAGHEIFQYTLENVLDLLAEGRAHPERYLKERGGIRKEYALYRDEELLLMGTVKEIAEQQGVSQDTIRFYGRPAYQKRTKNGYRLVEIEE